MSDKAPESPEKKYTGPAINYDLADGKIMRTENGESIVVAHYDGKIVKIVPERANFRTAVIRWLNDNEKPYEGVVLLGDDATPPVPKEKIPPMPKKDMRLGDKTPAVVEWYRKYKPAEFKARYGIKGEGTVTKTRVETDEKGNKVNVPYEVEATLADRKIHLTEKVEAGTVNESEYNDE